MSLWQDLNLIEIYGRRKQQDKKIVMYLLNTYVVHRKYKYKFQVKERGGKAPKILIL